MSKLLTITIPDKLNEKISALNAKNKSEAVSSLLNEAFSLPNEIKVLKYEMHELKTKLSDIENSNNNMVAFMRNKGIYDEYKAELNHVANMSKEQFEASKQIGKPAKANTSNFKASYVLPALTADESIKCGLLVQIPHNEATEGSV